MGSSSSKSTKIVAEGGGGGVGRLKPHLSSKVLPDVVAAVLAEHTPILSCFHEPDFTPEAIEAARLKISSFFVRVQCNAGSIFAGKVIPRRALIFVEEGDCFLVKNDELPSNHPNGRRVTMVHKKPVLKKVKQHDCAGMTELVRGVQEEARGKEFPTDIVVRDKATLLVLSADIYDKKIKNATSDEVFKTFVDHLESMTFQGVVSWLQKIEFLKGLDDSHLNLLARIAHFESFHENAAILKQGSSTPVNSARTNRFYVVLAGELEVTIARNNVERVVGQLRAGEFFGESTLLRDNSHDTTLDPSTLPDPSPYRPFTSSASVVTKVQTLLFYFDPDEFREACVFMPEIAVMIYESIRTRYAGQLHSLNLPIFAGLDQEELKVFTHSLVMCKYDENSLLFEKEAIGDEFYILLQGSVVLEVDEHTNVTLASKGDYFGELALIRSAPRSATARAATNCLCAVVAGIKFRETLLSSPVVAAEFELRALRERVSVPALLTHPVTHDAFRAHLDSEFAAENYKFIDAVQAFKQAMAHAAQLRAAAASPDAPATAASAAAAALAACVQQAKSLHAAFVAPSAVTQVNLSNKVTKALGKIFDGGGGAAAADDSAIAAELAPGTFDAAVHNLESSLKGNLARFVATQVFKDALSSVSAYVTKESSIVDDLPPTSLHPERNSVAPVPPRISVDTATARIKPQSLMAPRSPDDPDQGEN